MFSCCSSYSILGVVKYACLQAKTIFIESTPAKSLLLIRNALERWKFKRFKKVKTYFGTDSMKHISLSIINLQTQRNKLHLLFCGQYLKIRKTVNTLNCPPR